MDVALIMRYIFFFTSGIIFCSFLGMMTGLFERDYTNFHVLYKPKWECNSYVTNNENVNGKWVSTYECVDYRRIK